MPVHFLPLTDTDVTSCETEMTSLFNLQVSVCSSWTTLADETFDRSWMKLVPIFPSSLRPRSNRNSAPEKSNPFHRCAPSAAIRPSTHFSVPSPAIPVKCSSNVTPNRRRFVSVHVCVTRRILFILSVQTPVKCDQNGDCQVTIHNRNICSPCRLAKCFASGMRKELIRCSRQKKNTVRAKKANVGLPIVTTGAALHDQPQQTSLVRANRSTEQTSLDDDVDCSCLSPER